MRSTIDGCVRNLESSTMFHMSLGSKELFHSNFLHWISIINWDAFLSVMHGLASVEKFWWEEIYCPDKNNLEVRRESQSFDLSIYILIEETTGEKKQKWIPVLVLENKVKSIPYKEQLRIYEEKAKKEWRKKDRKEDRYITFILLSLWKDLPKDILPVKQNVVLNPESRWTIKSYDDLSRQLSNVDSKFTDLNKKVLVDYTNFISSLDNLANSAWKIKDSDCWGVIYPWKQRKYEEDPYVKLRIHDLWEKIHYEQLLKFLMDKLKEKNVKITQDKDEYKNQKDSPIVLCSSGYAHNIGLFEVWVKNDDEDYIIQVQGNSYHRGYLCGEGTNLEDLRCSYFLREMKGLEFSYKKKKVGGESLYSFKDSNRTKVFYYSKAEIDSGTKISRIIEAMCDDITQLSEKNHHP